MLKKGTAPQRVLDCACGVGYGSDKLASFAGEVHSVDNDRNVIMRARARYSRENIHWHNIDAGSLTETFEPESFDAIVSFQTIECLEDDRRFLADAVALLKPGGRLLIDTPTRSRHVSQPDNPHQKRNYSTEEWIDMLLEHFPKVESFDDLPERRFLAGCDFPSNGAIACCTRDEGSDAAD